ncbi:MAG: ribosomal protein S18-alanine N-acetyltransferase [Lachnospiraceae bacterium]
MENREILVRPMQKEDVPAISKLEEEAFSMPWKPEDFLDMVDREGSLYVTALCDGKVIGCCGVTNACGDGDINNVVVAEDWRGQGVGKKMLETLMEWGKRIGIENYTLEVRVSNTPAIRLYESLGFESAGIRPGFYDRPKEDASIMWKRQP